VVHQWCEILRQEIAVEHTHLGVIHPYSVALYLHNW